MAASRDGSKRILARGLGALCLVVLTGPAAAQPATKCDDLAGRIKAGESGTRRTNIQSQTQFPIRRVSRDEYSVPDSISTSYFTVTAAGSVGSRPCPLLSSWRSNSGRKSVRPRAVSNCASARTTCVGVIAVGSRQAAGAGSRRRVSRQRGRALHAAGGQGLNKSYATRLTRS